MSEILKKFRTLAARTLLIAVFTLVQSGIQTPVRAIDLGLSTKFSDVILENLQIGESYNLTSVKSLPLTIINGSSIETGIQVDVEAPTPEELKEGYEAIPDPTWVKVLPDNFRLAPQAQNLSDIIIQIPNDPKLRGKHYQVMFWAHTLETGFLGVGVRVRVRFSIGADSPEVSKAEAARKRMLDLNFRLDPVTQSAANVPLGKTVDLKAAKNVQLKLVNTGESALKLKVACEKYADPQRPPVGYEPLPDVSWLKTEPATVNAKPDTITPIKLKLRIPNEAQYRGKKYAAIVKVSLVGESIPVNVYSQILIETESGQ